MRLHHLEVTAFGPFAETVTVDFDRLSSAGLFLLTGPTGAGKSSVLDAVCFALYGDVPGDRNSAKRLRCDQAAPGLRPEVVLEATLSGRRFRIVRSPSWQRPKRRGSGLTVEQASVSIAERRGGAWVTHSTRLDETGHLVTSLLGMNVAQFTQVAMLPQGRFQSFLRARSEDRHRLLQQLFRTGRFESVERWLRDRRLGLKRTSEAAHERLADLISRISETTGSSAPDIDAAAHWSHELLDDAADECAVSAAAAASAAEGEAVARTTLDSARSLAKQKARLETAAAERHRLLDVADELDGVRHRLAAARRAAGVVPLHQLAVSARRARSAAHTEVARLEVTDRATLERLAAEAVEAAARLRALQPRVARLAAVERELVQLTSRHAALARAADRALADARSAVRHMTDQLVEARTTHAAAREQAQELRERALDLREQRLTGMAAEIAGQLAVGASCPVCGSNDHPHKATAVLGAPDDTAEKSAQRAADDAAAIEFVRRDELRALETRCDAANQQIDVVPPEIATESTAVATRIDALNGEAGVLRGELADYDESQLAAWVAQEDRARRGLEALDRLATAEQTASSADGALIDAAVTAGFDSAEEALSAALDTSTYDQLSTQVADHDRRLAAVSAVLDEPDADEIAAAAPPDVDELQRAHTAALDQLTSARARESSWMARSQRLTRLVADLDAALAQWWPLRDELELTTRLSAFVDGKALDNRLQMRLSAYVLAYRLSQVVAAANARLARMSDQRYSLEHTGRRGAGETRGGLSILVRDDWSGEARDPATLSGGETFVVSLALALGLADVVTQEAGGADLDTLFVDEGFGSLDADTLDDVLDTLDSLRDGGRIVGVVSHVAEMRDRIPAQLRVSKSRRGSDVTIT